MDDNREMVVKSDKPTIERPECSVRTIMPFVVSVEEGNGVLTRKRVCAEDVGLDLIDLGERTVMFI